MQRVMGAAAALALVSALAAPASAQVSAVSDAHAAALAGYPKDMNQAQSDYVEHCGGCHGVYGDASPADLPTLKDRVGWFACLPEGRSYLVRLPNISRSRITDNDQLADLLNFMMFGLGGKSVPAATKKFTGAEVARERTSPFTSVSLAQTRALLVERLIRQCSAPASLRLMYPGQSQPAVARRK
jgi:hypothetical protein